VAITLAVTDNGDGTGAVATVAGSDGGGTNTLFRAPFAGLQQNLAWTASGTRTGNGTIAVNPGSGQYFWYVTGLVGGVAALSNVTFQALTDQTTSVHYRCLTAVQQRIQGLSLSGISSAQVVIKFLGREWPDVDNPPNVMVVPYGKEGQPGLLAGRDDIEYPVVVLIFDKLNQDYTSNLARDLLWRQQIFRALRHQRLVGVPEVITVTAEPDFVVNLEAFNRNVLLSGLRLLCRSREVRG
jgi:hypothetical protein